MEHADSHRESGVSGMQHELIGELINCLWSDGLCLVVDAEHRSSYFILKIYQFETQEYFWIDEEEVKKLKLFT